MRIFVALALGSLLMVGCGDDGGGTGGTGGSAGSGGSAGGGGSAGTGGGTGGIGGGASGLSVQVSWEPGSGCAQGTRSDWNITVEVTNEVAPVTVDGSVASCSGAIDMVGLNTISCPNNQPYDGTVSVSDAVGTDEVNFEIGNCTSGSAQ